MTWDNTCFFSQARKLIPIWFAGWVGYSAINYPYEFVVSLLIGVTNGSIYALIAVGFGLIYNTTKSINLAHGEVFMLAAVGSAFLLVDVVDATNGSMRNWIWLFVAFVLAAGLGALVSLSTEVLVFSRLRRTDILAPLIASLGIALILQNIGIKWNGSGPKKFHSVIPEAPPFNSLEPAIARAGVILLLTLPVLISLYVFIQRSRVGRSIQAVANDVDAARLMGVNVTKVIRQVFVLAGATAGVAGLIYAQQFRETSYSLGMEIGMIAYAAANIGGVGQIRGTIFGGLLIGIVEATSSGVTSGLGYRWSQTAIYSVFILMLVYKPEGIWGNREAAHD